ncbi:hypothetical protein M9434_005145 [Picochlorum sp. BPE23]|nr:hypothetical protein M9434_005145 [Picochlorum sp. BPE23]KAI8101291.1 hypothetical protein M9435_001399 [Picochlorum sp. BPE23]
MAIHLNTVYGRRIEPLRRYYLLGIVEETQETVCANTGLCGTSRRRIRGVFRGSRVRGSAAVNFDAI